MVEFYPLSAEQGDAEEHYDFGRCFEHGSGIHQDLNRASEYYGRSAPAANPNSHTAFGRCLVEGLVFKPIRCEALL